jgi:hypothetical protein
MAAVFEREKVISYKSRPGKYSPHLPSPLRQKLLPSNLHFGILSGKISGLYREFEKRE